MKKIKVEMEKIEFYNNPINFDILPKKKQVLFLLGMILMCSFGYILANIGGVIRYGRSFLLETLPDLIIICAFFVGLLYFAFWLPGATLCRKVGFGENGIYIINGLNKYTKRPLYIPYTAIKKLTYVPWYDGYSVRYINKKGKLDLYATAFTKENIERLRERLRKLKEEGKWDGNLEIVRVVAVGMRAVPEDELTVMDRINEKR